MNPAIAAPRLVTARLTLSVPTAADAARMLAYQEANLAHLARWSPPRSDGADTVPYWKNRLAQNEQDLEEGSAVRFALFDRTHADSPILGVCNLTGIMLGPFRACLLGYSVDHRHQGKGLMFEAITAVVDYAFRDLRLHRVMANYLPTNERSGALLRRAGFVVEGYARDYLFIDGKFRDHVLTAITNHDLKDAEKLCVH